VINKFRGDPNLLTDGLRFLERKTHKPVLGILPYLKDLSLEEEDGVALDRLKMQPSDQSSENKIKMGVIYLPHISNFTDYDPLKKEPDVELFYVRKKGELACADVVILPGSKNTIEDLIYLRNLGLDQEIQQFYHHDGQVIGICGGVQMLGRTIRDPYGVESDHQQVQGLGLLAVETRLERGKITAQVQAKLSNAWREEKPVRGSPPEADARGLVRLRRSGGESGPPQIKAYEIHMGRTRRLGNTRPAFTILKRNDQQVNQEDGAISPDGRVWGTYLHGLFENDSFRRWFLSRIRVQKGWPISPGKMNSINYDQERERAFDHLAEVARENLNLKRIYELL
jgi:adenosylcobyric acid synthase